MTQPEFSRQRTAQTSRVRPAARPITARRVTTERTGLRRFAVIAMIYLLLTTSVATAAVISIHGRAIVPGFSGPTRNPAKYLVLIVLDGARPDYFGMESLPHVDALRAEGTQYTNAFDGLLESETPTGHTTIATGSTPARNGILGFDWAQDNKDYSIFDPNVVDAGAMEHIMEAAKVPTIAGLYKQAHPGATVVALSGHKYYAADPMGGPDADAIMYYEGDPKGRYVPVAVPGHVPPAGVLTAPGLIYPTIHLQPGVEDSLATTLALSAVDKMRPHILMINYPEFDWPLGHVDGFNPAATDVLMKNFDQDLGRIEDAYRKAGILGDTLFLITADHGMAPLKRFVPETVVTNAVSQAGTTAPAISYSTGAYVWLTDTSKSQAVAQNIMAAKDPGVQSAYYLTTVNGKPTYQLASGTFVSPEVDRTNQYLLGTLINGHQPSVVAFSKEGQSFSATTTNWKADHGGNGWEAQHIPLILSGPGIRQKFIDTQPAQLEDVAPTVLSDMGVKPAGMEGHILTDALQDASDSDVKARATEVQQIQPYVSALIDQSKSELGQQ